MLQEYGSGIVPATAHIDDELEINDMLHTIDCSDNLNDVQRNANISLLALVHAYSNKLMVQSN